MKLKYSVRSRGYNNSIVEFVYYSGINSYEIRDGILYLYDTNRLIKAFKEWISLTIDAHE